MKKKSATFSDKELFVEDESCLEMCHGQFIFHSPRTIKLVLYNQIHMQGQVTMGPPKLLRGHMVNELKLKSLVLKLFR